jgi:predicted GIY-YIG superfamily endonuclease
MSKSGFYYVYILLNRMLSFRYVGITLEPKRRLTEHNSGHTASTASHRPYAMILIRKCSNRLEARRTEKHFKSGYGRKTLDHMLASHAVTDRIAESGIGIIDLVSQTPD